MFASVRDAQGRVVRNIAGATAAGLQQIVWDLRLEKPDPVSLEGDGSSLFGGVPVGPLALPGEYSVQLNVRIDGISKPIGSAQNFQVKPLPLSPEITNDRVALQAFQLDTSELVRSVAGAVQASAEMRDRIAHLHGALDRTAGVTEVQAATLRTLQTRLDELDQSLLGDSSLRSRNEPVPVPIRSRINSVRNDTWHSQAPVAEVHKKSYEIAVEEFSVAVTELRSIQSDLVELESQFEGLGAPWTPGRLPQGLDK